MITKYLKKQKNIKEKRRIIKIMIVSLNIPEKQKVLYLDALIILEEPGLNDLYTSLSKFIDNVELTNLEEINKKNFSVIDGMLKKEAIEKQKELNGFSFLISNL